MVIEIDFINTAEPASYRFVIDPTALRMNIERHLLVKDVLPLERFMADRVFGALVDMQATGVFLSV